MGIAFRMFPAAGIVVLFDEPNQIGDVHDIDAPRNAPAKTPSAHLDKIYFHSDLDYLEVHAATAVNVSHAAVASAAPSGELAVPFSWTNVSADHLLIAHNLGYAPFALVAVGSNILWPGMQVQVGSVGAGRYASVYSTPTGIYLYEWASVGQVSLPATVLNYSVLIFKEPPAASGNQLFNFDPDTGVVQMGLGKFNSGRRYLQVVPGGSPLGLAMGRTIDLNNGAPRAIRPDGTIFNPVPPTLRTGLVGTFQSTIIFGAGMGYGGSYTGAGAIQVQAP